MSPFSVFGLQVGEERGVILFHKPVEQSRFWLMPPVVARGVHRWRNAARRGQTAPRLFGSFRPRAPPFFSSAYSGIKPSTSTCKRWPLSLTAHEIVAKELWKIFLISDFFKNNAPLKSATYDVIISTRNMKPPSFRDTSRVDHGIACRQIAAILFVSPSLIAFNHSSRP